MFFSGGHIIKKKVMFSFLSRMSKAYKLLKRTFLSFHDIKTFNASATVEALLILPVVFMFFMSVVWILALFYIHSMVGNIVNDAGYKIVSYSYLSEGISNYIGIEDNIVLEAVGSLAVSEGYVRKRINESEAGQYINDLTCILSHIDMDREVNLVVKYRVKPFMEIPGFSGFILTNRFFSRTYSGYSVSEGERKRVYITANSVVYHTDENCRALKQSVEKVRAKDISKKRNKDRHRYYSCKKCYRKDSDMLYVTPYGIKYHSDDNCADLKVTVYTVWDIEVKGRRKCYFCQ